MSQTKIERLLRFMVQLAGNSNHTIDEIAANLNITSRSAYRYIETLKNSGIAVEKVCRNVYKLGQMPCAKIDFSKLIYFSEEEAHIIHSLIHSIDNTNQLKHNLQRKLAAIYKSVNLAEIVSDKSNSLKIETLGNAIQTKNRVILKNYESAHTGVIRDRIVEPFAFSTNYIDIWAFDLEQNKNKVFKISRIERVETQAEKWIYESEHHNERPDCFRMTGNAEYPISLELSLRAKNLLVEEYPLAERDLIEQDGKWTLRTTVKNLAGVGRFVMGLAGEISVVESDELKDYLIEYSQKHIIEAYKKKTRP